MGHGVRTVRDLGLQRAGDEEHMLLAARNRWIIVTHNANHFKLLHDAWYAWQVAMVHGGILIAPHGPPEMLARLVGTFPHMDLPIANRLYEWRRHGGWHPYPESR